METEYYQRFVSLLTRDTLALVLAGGRGTRLHELCQWRAKPALYFGGKFRLIDFPLSNCVNSGVRRIGVLTQYKAHSLIRHLVRGWSMLESEFGEFLEILPASQRYHERWYAGTADAVWQNLDIIRTIAPRFILILAGDHVYKMDYGPMIAHHVEKEADITIGCIEAPLKQASSFGVISVDEDWWIRGFDEKPAEPRPMPGRPDRALASMGIYVFGTEFLLECLATDESRGDSSHDFGRNIVPAALAGSRLLAFPFREPHRNDEEHAERQAYWRDVGTIDAFWASNIELVGVTPELNLYDDDWPILTYQRQLPPAKFVFDDDDRRGMAVDSMVSGGCIISGARLRRSLLFSDVRVNEHSKIEDAVILPAVDVERRCRIRKAVIDRGCRIPEGTVIGEDPDEDARRFRVTETGVVLVTPEMLGQSLATRVRRGRSHG